MNLISRSALLAGAFGLSACGYIPSDGPGNVEIAAAAHVQVSDPSTVPFALVKVTPALIDTLSTRIPTPKFAQLTTSSNSPRETRVGIGDIIGVTIYEARSDGFFGSGQQAQKQEGVATFEVPEQEVDQHRTISVPYAGEISVVGLTPQAIQEKIVQALSRKAIDPRVVVRIRERKSGKVNVLGEVFTPQQFTLDPGGVKLLDALSRAGGPKFPAFETIVTIQRRGLIEKARLTSVLADPRQNIYLQGNDSVFLAREPRVFLTFGATPPPGSIGGQNNRRFIFETETLTMAEALAKSGGLDSLRANPSAVYLYRFEDKSVIRSLGVGNPTTAKSLVPIVYHIDLRDPDGFFLANAFAMQDGDILFVGDAPANDVNKFVASLRGFTGASQEIGQAAFRFGSL